MAHLERDVVNRMAVRLDLPLYWTSDANKNGAIDPDEVATLRFYPTYPEWTKDGAFTKEFTKAYTRIERAAKTDAAGIETPDAARQKLVGQELDEAAGALVRNDFRKASEEDRAFVARMLEVARLIDALFTKQTGADVLAKKVPADDPASQSLFRRNGGPECLTPKMEKDPACSAIPGAPKRRVDVYPASLAEDPKFCEKLEKRPDAKKLLDPFVVVREKDGKLSAVPYAEAYKEGMTAVAKELRAAADVVKDPKEEPLRTYLRAAAQSFESNDWRPADEAWSKMSATNSRWYVRVGPDEVYWEPCSQKAGFHLSFARINEGSLAWQQKLSPLQQEMEDSVATLIGEPYKSRKVTFHLPDFIDIVANAGDSRDAIGATIGQSLPNWGPVSAEGRGRTVAMSNLYTDPDSQRVRRMKAESLFSKASMAIYVDDPGPSLLSTILHEATHNLGPSHEYKYQGKTDAMAFGGDLSSMMEELKAQSGALFYIDFGKKKGIISPELARQTYIDSLVWAMNHISRGMWADGKKRKPYSQLAAIHVGFLMDEKVLTWDPEALAANGKDKGAFTVDFDKLPAAAEKLMKTVGAAKATNDKKAAESLSEKYVDGPVVPHKVIAERCLRFPQPSFVYAVDLLPGIVLACRPFPRRGDRRPSRGRRRRWRRRRRRPTASARGSSPTTGAPRARRRSRRRCGSTALCSCSRCSCPSPSCSSRRLRRPRPSSPSGSRSTHRSSPS